MIVALSGTWVLAAAQNRFFDSAGTQIHDLEEGEGPPVVLLHGFTSSAETWVRNGVFAALVKHDHVIALDCRGHGQSGKLQTPGQYGREMGRDMIRVLDVLVNAARSRAAIRFGGPLQRFRDRICTEDSSFNTSTPLTQ